MEIIPAIDLQNGKCVRLLQGDFNKETVFSEEPVKMALKWQSLGARRLHLVDLDGARYGSLRNTGVIQEIIEAVSIPAQVGGGIRSEDAIRTLLSIRVNRVILGTAAIENQQLIQVACAGFGEAIAIGIDAVHGMVAIHGWQDRTSIPATELVSKMEQLGARRIIYTDISRDGMLTEPNFEAYRLLKNIISLPLVASGGVSNIEHLTKLKEIGVEGAIIGRALYTGHIDLREAIKAVE